MMALLLLIAGCATIMQGPNSIVSINTPVSDVKIQISSTDGFYNFESTTPCSLKLPSRKNYLICVTDKKYESQIITLDRTLSAWLIGDILWGGIFGLAVDFLTGSAYKLSPNVFVNLVKKYGSLPAADLIVYGKDLSGNEKTARIPLVFTEISK